MEKWALLVYKDNEGYDTMVSAKEKTIHILYDIYVYILVVHLVQYHFCVNVLKLWWSK